MQASLPETSPFFNPPKYITYLRYITLVTASYTVYAKSCSKYLLRLARQRVLTSAQRLETVFCGAICRCQRFMGCQQYRAHAKDVGPPALHMCCPLVAKTPI